MSRDLEKEKEKKSGQRPFLVIEPSGATLPCQDHFARGNGSPGCDTPEVDARRDLAVLAICSIPCWKANEVNIFFQLVADNDAAVVLAFLGAWEAAITN